ncbi:carbohydrate ABC transporter substrate-binding protein, CUT1 family [Micromonospora echinaurantiaca]|uniref:Carbohydrate ABC transporter substrate-binding protein, CUT1 family n=1 Tax=Micromonospora echinaurantiaca TaxID=47857 RepID=A0A1C5IAN7_9ACTN|nr:sugar ABC transporter substrate-binding protein [Micromonospora echinaurantiaca]SCG55205.1 carbohydrate ABC transporter substrate-binding protein, CUT1 family [Micromonospora echinaurantiaca]
MTNTGARRWLGLVMAALLLGYAAAGCGDGDRAEDASGITVVLFGDAEEIAGYRTMVTAFEQANRDVDVNLSPVAGQDELMARLTTAFAGGKPPDVFLLNYRRYGQFAAQGAIEPAQSYLERSTVLKESDFSPRALDAFRYDGKALTCLPQNLSSLVVYYNADLFAAAGVPLPKAGWTWDDFLATARALTRDGRYGLGVEPSVPRLAPFVWSNRGELVDDPARPTALTLRGDPATRAAVDWFLDLQLKHRVVPPDAEEQSESSEARFLRGTLGMYLNSRVAVPTLRTIEGFTWDVAPLPVAPGGVPASILHSDAYCMSAGLPEHGDAWRFIEFAMGPQGQRILAESGRTVPSRLDVANSPVFLDPAAPPKSARVYLDAEPHLRATPRTATWSRVEKETGTLLEELFYGRIDREEGLRRLEEQSRQLFALPVGGG